MRYDGDRVEDVDDLRMKVASTLPSTRVELEIFRNGKLKEIEVKLGRLESGDEEGEDSSEPEGRRLGLSVRSLSDETAERLGYEINPGGVVITAVEPFGPAARAGLRPREIILRVQGEEISTAEELRREVRKHDLEKGIRLTVLNGEAERFVVVKKRG